MEKLRCKRQALQGTLMSPWLARQYQDWIPQRLCCTVRDQHRCVAAAVVVHTDWHSWEWYGLCKVAHVTPHVGDPGADASRVLVSQQDLTLYMPCTAVL